MTPIFIDTAEVSRRLGQTEQAFLRKRRALEDHHSFPAPLAGYRRPLKWNAHAVTAWIANFRAGTTIVTPPPMIEQHNIRLLHKARAGRAGSVHA